MSSTQACAKRSFAAAAGVLPDLALKVVDLGQQLHSRRAAQTHTTIGVVAYCSFATMARPIAMTRVTMPSMRSVLLSLVGLRFKNTFSELQFAAITTTRLRNAAGPSPPSDAANAASAAGHSIPSGWALQRATMAISGAPYAPKKGT